jgi:hypothetical protein
MYLNISVNAKAICYCPSQISEFNHSFQTHITYPYITIVPCSLVTKHEQTDLRDFL